MRETPFPQPLHSRVETACCLQGVCLARQIVQPMLVYSTLKRSESVKMLSLPLTRDELGARVGRGARAAVGVVPSRSTR